MQDKPEYTATVVLPEDSPIFAKIKEFWQENKPASWKREPSSLGIRDVKVKTDELDCDASPIYKVLEGVKGLTFKTGTTYPGGDTKKIRVFNSKGLPTVLKSGTIISNDSEGALSGTMAIYSNKGNTGVTFYLDAVQITKLVTYDDDPGFGTVEDGFVSEEEFGEED